MQLEFEDSSLSLKKIISTFFKYKWINISIILATIFLGLLNYYRSVPVYESWATVEISANPLENKVDFFGNQVGMPAGLETEIDILKSEFLLKKTLHSIDLNVEYYKTKKFKTTKLYEQRPFIIKNLYVKKNEIYGKVFNIKHIDKYRYELSMKKSFIQDLFSIFPEQILPSFLKPSKKEIYRYGEKVSLDKCSFIIEKNEKFEKAKYSFVLNSYENIVKNVKNNLSIKPASFKSFVLKITYKDNIASRAKDFLNSYLQNYLLYSEKSLVEADTRTLDFIDEQLKLISTKLTESEDSLQGFKSSNNIADIETQKREVALNINNFHDQLNNAKIELRVVNKLYTETKKGNYNIISSIAKEYPVLNTMLENLEDSKLELERKLALLTVNHPEIISLSTSIKNIEGGILDISKGILDRSKERVNSLQGMIRDYIREIKKLPEIEKELVKHERVFAVNDKVYNYLLTKQSELSIEKASAKPDKKVLDFAKVASLPLSPKLSLTLAINIFLGLVFALLHTLLRLKLDTKIKDKYDVFALTDIPIFGMIPFVKNSDNYNSAYVLDEPNSITSEAFRNIKNNLEYTVTNNRCKIILVTSTVPNEGKTTISANLSAILGMGEKRVMLLSLDLRRPELHYKFSLSNKVGISDVLSNRAKIKEVIWENESFNNLNIITSGKIPPNPAELLASNRMKDLIDELSEDYDYIILDTPPFEYVSDALSLVKYADVTLFVLKSEFSEDRYIKEIDRLVKKLGIENPGIIINSVKAKYYTSKKFDYKYIYHEA